MDVQRGGSILNDIAAADVSGRGKALYVAAYQHWEGSCSTRSFTACIYHRKRPSRRLGIGKALVRLDQSLQEKSERPDISAEHVELADVDGEKRIIVASLGQDTRH